MLTNSAVMDDGKSSTLPIEDDAKTTDIEDTLAHYVRDQFTNAVMNRRRLGLEEKMLKCMRSMRMEYTPEEMALFESVDVYPGLSSLKARAGESWLLDIFLNMMDKPWTLSPTPLPDLPDWMKERIVMQLEFELQQYGFNDVNQLKLRAGDLKDAAYQDAQEEAQRAADNMERLIEDQLLEGGWRDSFGEIVADLMVFPVALIRAPVVENVKQLVWRRNKTEVITKPLIKSRRIDPFDAFPSGDSTTTQNGHFFIERARLTPETVYSAIGIDGFNEDAIRFVLDRYKNGYIERTVEDAERRYLEDRESPLLETRTLDTLIYNGKVKGELLLEHGVLVEDAQCQYEVEVWTIANYTIRAVLNPNPAGTRPVYGTSFKKNNGSFWGESPISLLFDTERTFNSFIRAAIKNAAFSSGPVGEVDTSRLADDDIPEQVNPYSLHKVSADFSGMGGGSPAFRFHDIKNSVPALLNGADYFYKLADDISGIPAYVMGNPQVQGGGRTLGGLTMLMGNAAKGIKSVALHIDKDIVEPIVTAYYTYNMLTSDDMSNKADVKVLARGASGLLQRELAQNKMTDLLQLITPFATTAAPVGNSAIVPANTVKQILSEVLKSTGINVKLPNESPSAQLLENLAGAAKEGGPTSPVPAATPPQNPSPINLPQGS